MNYIEQDVHNKVVKFEHAMGQLAKKVNKPAKRIRMVKTGIQKIKWSYVAMAAGLVTSFLIFRSYKSH